MSSNIRRHLLFQIEKSAGYFDKAIAAINQYSGEKYILKKYDNTQKIWVIYSSSYADTSYILRVFDLNGQLLGSISGYSKRHGGCAIDNYAFIYHGESNNQVKYDVFELSDSGIQLLKTSPSIGNWPSAEIHFAYKDNYNKYHVSANSNTAYNCVFDYNMSDDTVSRQETSGFSHFITWYRYDGQYYYGLMWNYISGSEYLTIRYIKSSYNVGTFSSNHTPILSNSDYAIMIPIFDFKNSSEDLKFEVFCPDRSTSPQTLKNVLGLEKETPTSLSFGDIESIYSNDTYWIFRYGAITYVENQYLHILTYNTSTQKIEQMR